MVYKHCQKAIFLSRPNRFIALVSINGKTEVAHVKNTGRCRELLIEGREVILSVSDNPQRKTKYDLIAVWREGKLINMDSQAPNRAVEEWLRTGGLFSCPSLVKPEATFGHSRFDFYVEAEEKTHYIEVKGVTLEQNGTVYFPDAPTERGAKHLLELIEAKRQGHEAWVLFVIQMEDVSSFRPNTATDPAFAAALSKAKAEGVHVLAYDTKVTETSISMDKTVQVIL